MSIVSGMQEPNWTREGLLEFNNGTEDRIKLSRGNLLRALYLVVTFQVDIDAADNTTANLARGDGLSAIKDLELQVSGNKDIKNYTGPLLRMQNYRYFGQMPYRSTELGNGNADPNVMTVPIIPLFKPDALNPFEYSLDTTDFRNVSLKCEWVDAATDILTNANGFLSNPQMEVWSKTADATELRKQKGDLNFTIWRETIQTKSIDQQSEDFTIELPLDGLVPGFHLNIVDDNNATGPGTADEASILNEMKVKSATDTPTRVPEEILRAGLPSWYGHRREFDGSARTDLSIADDNDREAHYFYTNPDDALQSESYDPKGQQLSELNIVLDESGPLNNATANVLLDQLFPPRLR